MVSFGLLCLLATSASAEINLRPVIGIMAEPTKAKGATSYIAASYVKWIESSGARVVPIQYDLSEAELTSLVAGLNGVLFPGGAVRVAPGNPYFEVTKSVFNLGIKANDNGEHFPMWGTCLGFEFLCVMGASSDSVLDQSGTFDSENLPIPLTFTPAANSSNMFGSFSPNVRQALATENVTMNFHKRGVTPKVFNADKKMPSFYKILATSVDRTGKEFIAAIEGTKYPVYGTQFHPEKNIFEWSTKDNIPHSGDAVLTAQAFSNFFVANARENSRKFSSEEELNSKLIYNYAPVFTGKTGGYFEQEYQFPKPKA